MYSLVNSVGRTCRYCSVGVDEGWEGCGQGVDKTQHDAKGIPTIDSAFPDTSEMVKQIHAKGLTAGWYLNGCKCGEHVEKKINYEGDIKSLHAFDFGTSVPSQALCPDPPYMSLQNHGACRRRSQD